jgi:hypothetical protein
VTHSLAGSALVVTTFMLGLWKALELIVAMAFRVSNRNERLSLTKPVIRGVFLPSTADPGWELDLCRDLVCGRYRVVTPYGHVRLDDYDLGRWRSYQDAVLERIDARRLERLRDISLEIACAAGDDGA